MIQHFLDWFAFLQGWLFENAVEPAMFALGLGEYIEDAFEGVEWFLAGTCEVAALYLVLRPLEAVIPVQRMTDAHARWNDFVYTLIHRLGLFGMAVFFTLDPVMDAIAGGAWYAVCVRRIKDVDTAARVTAHATAASTPMPSTR